MFGARNVVRPSARGGKGGRPIQAPMRGRRRGSVKPSRQAKLFDPRMQGRINKVGGRGSLLGGLGKPTRGRSPARAAQSRANKLASMGASRSSKPSRGRGSLLGRAAKTARRPQYKRR